MSPKKIYFPNLNTLRFFAAFLVVICHIEQFKLIFSLPNIFTEKSFAFVIGKVGVVLFFVLSGFLITYLLLAEEYVSSTISIKSFYMRRILKIWPLYFLIFILAIYILPLNSFFIIPGFEAYKVQENLFLKTILYIFFLPNLLMIATTTGDGFIPGAGQLWSIGTEEQFYLFWPVLFKKIKVNRFVTLFGIIAVYIVVKKVIPLLPYFSFQKNLNIFWNLFNVDCMAIGGIFALIHFRKKEALLKILYNKYLQWGVLIVALVSMFRGVYFSYFFFYEIYGVMFGILILNFATNPKPIFSLENKVTNYLGKISYGIYMYHCIAIIITLKSLMYFHLVNNVSIYAVTICLTILLSMLSYHFFEDKFIRLKSRFSNIISGDNAKGTPARPEIPVTKEILVANKIPIS